MTEWSETWTWMDGTWHEGNVPFLGVRTHAGWLGSSVFDGARVFEGTAPDLDLHCERVNRSAKSMNLDPSIPVGQMLELVKEGREKFTSREGLYVRPMYWAEEGGFMGVPPLAESTRFCMCLYVVPMPEPVGFSAVTSRIRRPAPDQAPVYAKAGCLYPMGGQAMLDARSQGYDNAVILDPIGNVAEFATANLWYAKDGVAFTPVPNGTFLNGITRQRVAKLLSDAGTKVVEKTVTIDEVREADEVFSTGNFSKVMPITRLDDREFQPGPIGNKARELYWEYAHSA
ncbi:MAG: branched-chain amino acid aminotransferase [Pseudomonadota bacterium]